MSNAEVNEQFFQEEKAELVNKILTAIDVEAARSFGPTSFHLATCDKLKRDVIKIASEYGLVYFSELQKVLEADSIPNDPTPEKN